jgi:outer membrane immunogenic protein
MSALSWAGSAAADGMNGGPVVAETSRCGSGAFNGFYIGGALGYGEHNAEIRDRIFGDSFDDDDGVFTGGVLWGYNYQCGRWLVGYEGDINFFDSDAEANVDTISLNSSIDWYGTSRIRLGLVHDERILFYATGGLAYAEVDHRFSDTFFSFSQTDGDTQFGWVIGGGVEFLHAGNWTIRAEGMFVDLGDETENYEITSANGLCTTTCQASAEWEDDFWVTRVGFTYRFGAREEPVVPLK